jgi:hypothetical protein
MYLCMHACMYVRMYVFMYACMYVRTYVFIYVCIHVCMYVRTYVCVYICMYVLKALPTACHVAIFSASTSSDVSSRKLRRE